MGAYKLTVVIWKEPEGYVSKCPELGVASCGSTVAEARENLKEAVELYLENAKALNIMEELEPALTAEGKTTDYFEVAI